MYETTLRHSTERARTTRGNWEGIKHHSPALRAGTVLEKRIWIGYMLGGIGGIGGGAAIGFLGNTASLQALATRNFTTVFAGI